MKLEKNEDRLINDYIDGILGEAEKTDFQNMLESDKQIRQKYTDLQRTVQLCRDLPEIDLPRDFSEVLHNKLAGLSNAKQGTGMLITFRSRYVRIASAIAACIAVVLILRFTMFTEGFFNANTQRDAGMLTRAAEGDTMMSLKKQESVSESAPSGAANFQIATDEKTNAYDNLKVYAAGMGYDFSDIPPGLGRSADNTEDKGAAKSIKIIIPAQKYDEFSKWLLDNYGSENAVSFDKVAEQEGSVVVIIEFIDAKHK